VPRLWIDMVAHVAMGRDKRTYRLLHDTAYGRRVLAESTETAPLVEAVTRYVARRLIAREQAMVAPAEAAEPREEAAASRPSRGQTVLSFILGIIVGAIGLFVLGVYLTR
jgi:ABC-type ATPase with predicted acetyltransferase domain